MQIAVGQVFRLQCQTCNPPKLKYFVVACVDPFLCFLINSQATAFQQSNPTLMAALAPLAANDHPFLTHDSLLGCNMVFGEYTADEVLAIFGKDSSIYLGDIHQNAVAGIKNAIANPNLSAVKRNLILASW